MRLFGTKFMKKAVIMAFISFSIMLAFSYYYIVKLLK